MPLLFKSVFWLKLMSSFLIRNSISLIIKSHFLFCLETEKKQKSSRLNPIAPRVWASQRVNTPMDIPCGNEYKSFLKSRRHHLNDFFPIASSTIIFVVSDRCRGNLTPRRISRFRHCILHISVFAYSYFLCGEAKLKATVLHIGK